MDNTLDLLLRMDVLEPQTAEYRVKRLSKVCGQDVIFTLRELTYSKVCEIKRMNLDDLGVHTVLAGVISPDFKNQELLQKYGAATPAELVKKMLRPGEIEDISRAIERLCGYREDVIEEIKKN